MRIFVAMIGLTLILLGLMPRSDLSGIKTDFPEAEYIFYVSAGEVSTNIENANAVRGSLKDVRGEALRIEGADKIDALIDALRITIITEETVGDIRIIYGFSPYLNANTLKSSKINIQIAINGDTITAASPIIYGSY